MSRLAGFLTIPRLSMQWGFALAALLFLIGGSWLFLENSRLRNDISRTETDRDAILKREAELAAREKSLTEAIKGEKDKNAGIERELAEIREERGRLEKELERQRALTRQKETERPEMAGTGKRPVVPPTNRPPLSIASFILTPTLRGGGQLPEIALPAGTDSVEMRLELEADDFSAYRVALKDQAGTGRSLWQSGRIRAKQSGSVSYLSVRFPARFLRAAIYALEVSGIEGSETTENISSYSFRVVR